MDFEFDGPIFFWRGPAPWFFVSIPPEHGAQIAAIASRVTYGWGVIPARIQVGDTTWRTSLIPKEGRYLVPIRADIRRREGLAEGETIMLRVEIAL